MIFALAFAGLPMAFWALGARTAWGRFIGVLAFAGLAAAEWESITGRWGQVGQGAGALLFALLALALAISAPFLEVRYLRVRSEPSRSADTRIFLGQSLGFAYSALIILGFVAMILIVTL
ncbi:hypothetical protein [Nocardia stercoris]|uniref:Uncharacterized protein n=1 Tax=Nocardia stercoris TaxID=2483361 RepID=A0A3M2LB75_9NOCA|nr:hypothetical protein [Nocardia stercoris]RMI31888.1 hypothetical protein EBN03_17105 [Nocardia stercoris]